MRLPASSNDNLQNYDDYIRSISSEHVFEKKEKIQSEFWGLSIFTLLLALALLSVLTLGQNDH